MFTSFRDERKGFEIQIPPEKESVRQKHPWPLCKVHISEVEKSYLNILKDFPKNLDKTLMDSKELNVWSLELKTLLTFSLKRANILFLTFLFPNLLYPLKKYHEATRKSNFKYLIKKRWWSEWQCIRGLWRHVETPTIRIRTYII